MNSTSNAAKRIHWIHLERNRQVAVRAVLVQRREVDHDADLAVSHGQALQDRPSGAGKVRLQAPQEHRATVLVRRRHFDQHSRSYLPLWVRQARCNLPSAGIGRCAAGETAVGEYGNRLQCSSVSHLTAVGDVREVLVPCGRFRKLYLLL